MEKLNVEAMNLDMLTIRLRNPEETEELTRNNIPFYKMADIPVTIDYILDEDMSNGIMASFPITNALLGSLGKEMDELLHLGCRNSEKRDPARIMPLANMITALGVDANDAKNIEVYVLTTAGSINGAKAILYPGVMEEVYELFDKKPYYILPSSIHELLFVEKDRERLPELQKTVRNINRCIVDRKDKLSDLVYEYDGEKVVIAV